MVPILFGVYLILEYVEARWQQRIVDAVEKAGHVGPVIAAVGGAIPQCGFSVMASALYTQRLLTMGTIIAVYLATSDEALPILLSKPDKAHIVLPLIGVKVLLAVAGGYLVDAFMRSENRRRTQECRDLRTAEQDAVRIGEQNCSCDGTRASCTSKETGSIDWKEILWSATKRTAQINPVCSGDITCHWTAYQSGRAGEPVARIPDSHGLPAYSDSASRAHSELCRQCGGHAAVHRGHNQLWIDSCGSGGCGRTGTRCSLSREPRHEEYTEGRCLAARHQYCCRYPDPVSVGEVTSWVRRTGTKRVQIRFPN